MSSSTSHAGPLFRAPADRRALGGARAEIGENARTFRAFEARALREADPLAAIVYATVAADWASHAQCGILASPALERLLNELGRAHVAGGGVAPRRPGRERVLHVLTEAYDTGGHTRVVERWVARDRERDATVVLTAQHVPVPESLRAAGAALVEQLAGETLLERAAALRALAAEHDLVVLHQHEHDAVPALAFAEPEGRPPTVLFNHASHKLWLGSAAADVVANLWEPDVRHCVERRGVDAGATALLPIPGAPRTLPGRAAAREALGLPPDVPVFLSVGSAWKTMPVLEPSFAELVRTVLDTVEDAHALVVGPEPGPEWQRADGRLHVPGPLPDIAAALAAADVLLDTWPASGGTVLIDAATAGLPVLSLGDGAPELALVRPPAGSLDGAVVHAPTPERLVAEARRLAGDADARRELGERGRRAADALHGAGWTAHLEHVVETARRRHGSAQLPRELADAGASDWECVIHLLLAKVGHAVPALEIFRRHVHELPPAGRPQGEDETRAACLAALALAPARGRRALVGPELDPRELPRIVAELGLLAADGRIAYSTVVVAPGRLDEIVERIESSDGADALEIELVAFASPEAEPRPDDLCLA